MTKTLKLINSLVSEANPDTYNSISYNKYFRDLSKISDSIIEESEMHKENLRDFIEEINNLPESVSKKNLQMLLTNL